MSEPLGRLNAVARVPLGHFPTPLEELVNLGRACGQRIFVKRDDCTGLALGGNKVRQLEFYLGEARTRQADTLLVTGAVQSNLVRLAAAAARKVGLECQIQLEERVPDRGPAYRTGGNVFLDRLLGAKIHSYPQGEDEEGADARLQALARDLRASGRRPYVIPMAPGHPPLGALGYLVAARELLVQYEDRGVAFDEILVASGSGQTHAGLLFGLRALGSKVPVTGVCVRRSAEEQFLRVRQQCEAIAALIGTPNPVQYNDIAVSDADLAPGYGTVNQSVRQAIRIAAQKEGLLLDPVYSGRVLAALLRRSVALPPGAVILFLHTGGTPALFAYQEELTGQA